MKTLMKYLSIVRGLAANDERIIEYFKDKSLPKGGQKGGGAEIFSMISETLSESDFAEQLNIRIWEKLSRFNWMEFLEARKFVRSLNLKNVNQWRNSRNSNRVPNNIPSAPNTVYKNKGWISFGDWLGTGRVAHYNKKYRKFEDARDFARSLNLKSVKEWRDWCIKNKLPNDISTSPHNTYRNKGLPPGAISSVYTL